MVVVTTTTMNSESLCDRCEERVGVVACTHCSALLCEECDKAVHERPKFERHERTREENVLGVCSIHGMRASVLCEDCMEVCCRRCMTEQHAGHLFAKCAGVSEQYTDSAKLANALESAMSIGASAAACIQNSMSRLNDERHLVLDAIDDAFNRITELVEARRAALIESVVAIADKEENDLQTLYNDLDTQRSWAEQVLDDFQAQSQSRSGASSSSSPNGTHIIAANAEMEKCFGALCDNIKKVLTASSGSISKISFIGEQQQQQTQTQQRQKQQLLQTAGIASRPQRIRALFGQNIFIHGPRRTIVDPADLMEEKADDIKTLSIGDAIETFGFIKTDRQAQLSENALKKTMVEVGNDSNERATGAQKRITLTWSDVPEVIKESSKDKNFVFVLESREDSGDEFREIYCGREFSRTVASAFKREFRVSGCIVGASGRVAVWTSNIVKGSLSPGTWKEGPNYTLENNGRKAIFTGQGNAMALGEKLFKSGAVYEWKFRVEKSISIGCGELNLGVIPHDADTRNSNPDTCGGWFLGCFFGALRGNNVADAKKICSDKHDGNFVRGGDEVGIVLDMEKGEISFVLEGKNLGVAFKGMPLDKPLVPAVISCSNNNSVELISC